MVLARRFDILIGSLSHGLDFPKQVPRTLPVDASPAPLSAKPGATLAIAEGCAAWAESCWLIE